MLIHNLSRNRAFANVLSRSFSSKSSSYSCVKETEQMNQQTGNRFCDRSSVQNGKHANKTTESRADKVLGAYSGSGHVNLHGVTQSTVPKPFNPTRDSGHGHSCGSTGAGRMDKFVSNNLRDTHQSKNFSTFLNNGIVTLTDSRRMPLLSACVVLPSSLLTAMDSKYESRRCMCTQPKLNQKEKLKKAVKDYGSTVIIFHVAISLTSLGCFYLAVSSGLDMAKLLSAIGVSENVLKSSITTGASTFVVAYAVHKVFAPVRIGITLSATPFIKCRTGTLSSNEKYQSPGRVLNATVCEPMS